MSSCHSQSNPIILKTAVTSVNNSVTTRKANIFIDKGSSLSYITTQLSKELCIKPHCSKTVRINKFGGATLSNTYAVGSVNIITDEGAISVDTLIKDVIVAPIDRSSWPAVSNLPTSLNFSLQSNTFQSNTFPRPNTYWSGFSLTIPLNFNLALSRLQQVKKRLLKLDLWRSYANIIADQIDKGYVEAVPTKEDPCNEIDVHYLSHFFVLRPDSETTLIRVVFAANTGHVSLNDCLYTGPCLLKSLNTIVHRFRANKFAFVADIEKAFMRIKINEEDRNYVRFLWFEDGEPEKPIKAYRYTSVFFGGTSSPFILNSTILDHLSK